MSQVIDPSVFLLFIPTFFFVSVTPGMCMTLSMILGMTIGVKKTFWMMLGELLGIALVSIAAVVGVASIMLNYPAIFTGLKFLGGGYLTFLGVGMWRSRGKMAITSEIKGPTDVRRRALILQGFVTAIANPKGWAFMISLLPPFINRSLPLSPQLTVLVGIILTTEFLCMTLYASGGSSIRLLLEKEGNVRLMNRISGSLMVGVGIWLATG
jgi:homoserine/homoserine lactone efflux protein